MKVLTATSQTQGLRDSDYCYTLEGELVMFPPIECDCTGCGCRWGMAGLASHRATTTMMVADRVDLDLATYSDLVVGGIKEQGYLPEELRGDPEVQEWLRTFVDDLVNSAAGFEPGTVLERAGDGLRPRPTTGAEFTP